MRSISQASSHSLLSADIYIYIYPIIQRYVFEISVSSCGMSVLKKKKTGSTGKNEQTCNLGNR